MSGLQITLPALSRIFQCRRYPGCPASLSILRTMSSGLVFLPLFARIVARALADEAGGDTRAIGLANRQRLDNPRYYSAVENTRAWRENEVLPDLCLEWNRSLRVDV